MELTQEEKDFILGLLKQLTINPSSIEAGSIVEKVQSIISKLQ